MANDPSKATPIRNLTGKASLYIRGVAEYLIAADDAGKTQVPLRSLQDSGLAYVIAKGETMSVPYISTLTGRLEKEGFIKKSRFGKSFVVAWTEKTIDDFEEMIEEDYGSDEAILEWDVRKLKQRNLIINHMDEHQGVVITSEAPLPHAAFMVLRDRFNKGELAMMFMTTAEATILAEDFPEADFPEDLK